MNFYLVFLAVILAQFCQAASASTFVGSASRSISVCTYKDVKPYTRFMYIYKPGTEFVEFAFNTIYCTEDDRASYKVTSIRHAKVKLQDKGFGSDEQSISGKVYVPEDGALFSMAVFVEGVDFAQSIHLTFMVKECPWWWPWC